MCRFMTSATHLRVVSDAAFKKETEDGYSLRGALFLRCEGSITNMTIPRKPCNHALTQCSQVTSASRSSRTALSTSPAPVCQPPCSSRLCNDTVGRVQLVQLKSQTTTCRSLYCKQQPAAKTADKRMLHATARCKHTTMARVLYCKQTMTLYCKRTMTAQTLYCKRTALHTQTTWVTLTMETVRTHTRHLPAHATTGPQSRRSSCNHTIFTMTARAHVIEWACKSQRHVTRSTFAAELLSAGDAVDQGILVSQLMMETVSGPVSASTARQLRDNGGYSPMALVCRCEVSLSRQYQPR